MNQAQQIVMSRLEAAKNMLALYQKMADEAVSNFATIRDNTDDADIQEGAQHGIDAINKIRGEG